MRTGRVIQIGAAVLGAIAAGTAWALQRGTKEEQNATVAGDVLLPTVGVRLQKPDGFEEATDFDGIQQASSSASVMVVRIPGPYAEVTRGFDAAQLKTRGMTLKFKHSATFDRVPGVLLAVTQSASDTLFAKWIGVFGSAEETFLVTATFPQEKAIELSDTLKAVVLSAKRDKPAQGKTAPPADAGLPFTVSPGPKLKRTVGMGKMLLFTKEGVVPAKSPSDPLFVVAPSVNDSPIDGDRAAFARRRLGQTANTTEVILTSHKPVTINGLPGYESEATGRDEKTGTQIALYQVMLFDSQGYILMQGLVGQNGARTYLPEFKQAAHSFARK